MDNNINELNDPKILQLLSKAEKFEKNYEKTNPGKICRTHNVYILEAEDRDGNIVDTAYGINVLTDWGFSRGHFQDSSDHRRCRGMYLGCGIFEEIDPASSQMVTAISSTSAKFSDSGGSPEPSHLGNKWDSTLHCMIVQFRLAVGYFDYTVWSEDKTVTEIGLCFPDPWTSPSPNSLKYHSAIYDENGNRTTFEKKVNQKLTITVLGRCVFPIERIVNSSWDRGYPCMIRSLTMFPPYPGVYWSSVRGTYYSYNWLKSDYSTWAMRTKDVGTITDHVYSHSFTGSMNAFMDGRYQYLSEYVMSSSWQGNPQLEDAIFASKFYLDEPVSFELENYRVNNYNSQTMRFTYCWRNNDTARSTQGQLPMSNMHILSLKMYNGQTDEYDVDVPFVEPVPYLEAGYEHIRFHTWENNYIPFKEKYADYDIWMNEAPQYPIKAILNGGSKTWYVSDAYWDPSSWTIVQNSSNIPRELGSKRYFITFDGKFDYTSDDSIVNYGDRYYTRRVDRYDYPDLFPRLNLNNGSAKDLMYFGEPRNPDWYAHSYIYWDTVQSGKYVQNETYKYIAGDGFIVFVEDFSLTEPELNSNYTFLGYSKSSNFSGYNHRYCIGGIDLADNVTGRNNDGTYPGMIWNTPRGEHIASMGIRSWNKGCRVYTITMDPTVLPAYENFSWDQTWDANPTMTDTQSGYLVIGYVSGNNNYRTTYVLEYDVQGVAPNMYKVEGYTNAMTIDLTNYFVAIDPTVSTNPHLVIYDMENRQIHDEFDIPAGYSVVGCTGWDNFIYVRVDQAGAKSTFVYYIREQMLELTPLNIQQMYNGGSAWSNHIRRCAPANGSIESCMVLLASSADTTNEHHQVFKASDPTHPFELMSRHSTDVSTNIKNQKAWLGYTADNKHLILTYCGSRVVAIDLSWCLKHGTIQQQLTYGDLADSNSDIYSPIYYKGYIYIMALYSYYGEYRSSVGTTYYLFRDRYWRYPMEQWLSMKISGLTYSPNSMMNPVRVQGEVCNMLYQDTNRGVDGPDPYYPPTVVIVPAGTTSISSDEYKNNDEITGIVIPSSVETIASDAFDQCSALTDIYIDLPSSQTQLTIPSDKWGATNATIHFNDE